MPEEPTGSQSADGAPSDGSSSDSTPPNDPVIASDLFESGSSTGAPHSEPANAGDGTPASDFNPKAVDIRRTSLDEIPKEHRASFEPAYKAFKDLEAGYTKRDQDLQAAQESAQKAEQEWRDRIETLSQGPPAPSPAEALEQQLSDADLTPDQREGVNMVRQIVQAETAELRHLVSDLQGIKPAVESMQQMTERQQAEAMNQQVSEARSKHGTDVDNYGQQIAALIQTSNPTTGNNYTVLESYELVTGKAQAVADQARQTDQDVRNGAKHNATSPTGTPVVSHESHSDLSMAEARSDLESMGFER